jgi:hypothetical protein
MMTMIYENSSLRERVPDLWTLMTNLSLHAKREILRLDTIIKNNFHAINFSKYNTNIRQAVFFRFRSLFTLNIT